MPATPNLPAARLLVVDDEPSNLMVLAGHLVPLGYGVTTVTNGAEALASVERSQPDLILLDVMMPGIDGFEVCRRLKADRSTALIPVLMITALDADQHRLRGLEVGADDFLSKPVDEVELQLRVRSLTERSRLQAELHTTDAVLSMLATAIDVRDDVTGGHVQRLAHNADLFATALDLSAADRDALRWAAVLHDVGKLGVPDAVLGKPGPLTEDEWTIMRRHPELGESITAEVAGLCRLRPIVRHHHERWDGTGYPDGLARDETPYLARAFQLLDVFDALTAKRPYKAAMTRSEAVTQMRSEMGTTLDPALAEVFLSQVAQQCRIELRQEVHA